jgi:uncharacterized protein Yka (UPF0111/DUF47 family)
MAGDQPDRDRVDGDAAVGGRRRRGRGGRDRRRRLTRARVATTDALGGAATGQGAPAQAAPARRRRRLLGGSAGGLRRVVRELVGSVDDALVARLRGQIAAVRQGAQIAKQAAVGDSDHSELEQHMRAMERAGDDERAQLVQTLSTALMTSFDREDLFRVSRSIDDVLDNLYDFVREAGLFTVADEHCAMLLEAVEECLSRIDRAVGGIREPRDSVVAHALGASKDSTRVRQRYQEALADLLAADTVTPELLKRRELLRRLDVVGLRLGEAAAALSDGAVKRG